MDTIIIYKETMIKNSYRKENFKTEKKLLRDYCTSFLWENPWKVNIYNNWILLEKSPQALKCLICTS